MSMLYVLQLFMYLTDLVLFTVAYSQNYLQQVYSLQVTEQWGRPNV